MDSVDLLSFRQSIPPNSATTTGSRHTHDTFTDFPPWLFLGRIASLARGGWRNTILRAGVTYNTFYGRNELRKIVRTVENPAFAGFYCAKSQVIPVTLSWPVSLRSSGHCLICNNLSLLGFLESKIGRYRLSRSLVRTSVQ